MKLSDVFTSKAIAMKWTKTHSDNIPYLGTGLFPAQKKMGLDLKWVLGNDGLPISLMPSNFGAMPTLRANGGLDTKETKMAFFREQKVVDEELEQEIMRLIDSNDPFAPSIIKKLYDMPKSLIDGALVVPERMTMSLLAPIGGNVAININANNTPYAYNYDKKGKWKSKHYMKIAQDADKWTSSETCDPLEDIEAALDTQEDVAGNRPEILLMSKATFKLIKKSKKVQSGVLAQNLTATVNYTSKRIKEFIEEELGVKIVIYSKKYKGEDKTEHNFYPDNIIAFLPSGSLGTTWYGTTPEERTLKGNKGAQVSIVNTGIAVSVITENKIPIITSTTVSEIVLPSFERMNECYALEVA